MVLTPDLRGRFILGSNPEKIDGATTNFDRNIRLINETGGEETHKLTKGEMPQHDHGSDQPDLPLKPPSAINGALYANIFENNNVSYMGGIHRGGNWHASGPSRHKHNPEGNDQPHENMPPFYVLTYIIKKPIKTPTTTV